MPDLYHALELPTPFPDQSGCIEQLRDGIRAAQRANATGPALGQILVAPPGWGKTVVAQWVMAGGMEKGSSAVFVVDRLSLLEQTSRRFHEAGIPHGIYGGGDRNRGRREPIQIAMAQTIAKRGWPPADFVVIDECHIIYDPIVRSLPKLGVPYVGLSATPFVRGLGKIYAGGVVQSITTNALLEQGRLAPLRIKPAIEIDMDNTPLVNGEWTAQDVQTQGRRIIGDIVATWVEETNEHFGGPAKTMLFSASIAHGDELCASFQDAGYDFRQVSAHDDPDYRRETIEAFRHGEFPGIVSCELLSRGFDVPDLDCLVLARPYVKAFAAHIQMLGRGMRTAPGKEYCLALDHSGNSLGFLHETNHLFEHGVDALDTGRFTRVKRQEKREAKEHQCVGCGFVLPPRAAICPVCGTERKRRNAIETVPGQVIEIEAVSKGKRGWTGSEDELWVACCTAAAKWLHRHNDVKKATRQAKAHFRDLAGYWPPDRVRFVPGTRVPVAIQRQIDKRYRAWKKAQQQQGTKP